MLFIKIGPESVASHYTNKANIETSIFNSLYIKMEEILLEVDRRVRGKANISVQKEVVHFFTLSNI